MTTSDRSHQNDTEIQAGSDEARTLAVKVPDPGYSKTGYVNIRGASLNYVVGRSPNKESAHCSAKDD